MGNHDGYCVRANCGGRDEVYHEYWNFDQGQWQRRLDYDCLTHELHAYSVATKEGGLALPVEIKAVDA